MADSRSFPQRSVFRSTHGRMRVEVFADEAGVRVVGRTGEPIILMDWPLWLLSQGLHGPHLRHLGLTSQGLDEACRKVQDAFLRACQALPPGDDR